MSTSQHYEDLTTAIDLLDQLNGLFSCIETTTEKHTTNNRLASLGRDICDDWQNSFDLIRERIANESSE
ncbi:MAG: hypothetical protein EVA65_16030 [Oceanococcus sp.]|nr:MAG: hypothetical protein EVA65_16030 [Oceanococcus sp.]